MPPVRSAKKKPPEQAKSTKSAKSTASHSQSTRATALSCKSPEPGETYQTAQDASTDDDDQAYQTAQEDENMVRLFNEIKAGDNRRKAASRRRREAAFNKDIGSMKAKIHGFQSVSDAEISARQRTKEAVKRLTACLKRRSELEKKYLDAVETLRKHDSRFEEELLVAFDARAAVLQGIEVTGKNL